MWGAKSGTLGCRTPTLNDRFAGYHVADERMVRLGFDPNNPVNLPSSHGVQIELPPDLRGIGYFGEQLVPSEDGIVSEVIAAHVELANLAAGICTGTTIT